MFFKKIKGSSRKGFILWKFAIKVPILPPWGEKVAKQYFRKGFVANITEYAFYSLRRDIPFLTPTYFSFGFVNIQKYEEGREPTEEEFNQLIKNQLSQKALRSMDFVDSHHFEMPNFIVNEKGWHIVDYGDHFIGHGMTLAFFIVENLEELKALFSKPLI